jgi:aspartyl-tRNA(Asn)/glutamyl-tRNA(Gln) amidotransferase subunit A
MDTLYELAGDLEAGRTTAAALLDAALARIRDPSLEGARAFISLDAEGARAEALRMDELRRRNAHPSPFAGIPISIKDLFDVAGQVTTAGSVVLKDAPPAKSDAPAIARLKSKGFVIIGRTNMTEFAYSGVGLNPHYGTPLSPYDRKSSRIPGGSSSGAAVSVADGMCPLGIGTDTGGSCRIPASFCGLVGYKPSTGRVSTEGAYPLSYTLDSVGSMAHSVKCVALADAIMADDGDGGIAKRQCSRIRLGFPENYEKSETESVVAKVFQRALAVLGGAGVSIVDVEFPSIEEISAINTRGGITAVEAYSHHRQLIAAKGEGYDPRVGRRIANGANIPAPDYVSTLRDRAALIRKVNALLAGLDGIVLPTTPNVPPPMAALAKDEDYMRINFFSLRNTFVGNFLDMCAISLPVNEPGEPPVGLMIMAPWGSDQNLFATALAVESAVATGHAGEGR